LGEVLRRFVASLSPIAGVAAHVHDGDDLELIAPDAEDERVGKNFESALTQFPFETAVDFRAGDHAVLCQFPLGRETGSEARLLFLIPIGGVIAFLPGGIFVSHCHGLKRRAEALVDFFPEVFRRDHLRFARVGVADAPPQFFTPFGTQLKVILIQAFQELAGEFGAIHSREVESFFFQMFVGLDGDSHGSMDAANILKPALARGAIRLIGATAGKEYRQTMQR